jgi:hypothetical protein
MIVVLGSRIIVVISVGVDKSLTAIVKILHINAA